MKEALLYRKLKNNLVQCRNCSHFCVVSLGNRGICKTRENLDGILYALNYGLLIAKNTDPIEKKPLFHFLPGSQTFSIAALGCNFRCLNCQNYDISQNFKNEKTIYWGEETTPEAVVTEALKRKCPSISYTYTEPTIFLEFAIETMKLARKKGLKNIWVSNGFMSKESAELIIPYLDANNIDIKGFSESFYRNNCGAKLTPVLETAQLMKKSKVWLEITTLAIPTISDSEKMFKGIANFIREKLGPETPWHISRFSGDISWRLKHVPETSNRTIEMAYDIGKAEGLKYVYTGNNPGLTSENTFCSNCGFLAIKRLGYRIKRFDDNGACPKCKKNLDIIVN